MHPSLMPISLGATLPLARPLPQLWDGATLRLRLAGLLEACFLGLRAGYFCLMWAVTAYEVAVMAGVPMVFPAIRSGVIPPDAAMALCETASRSHVYLLPAVIWFLIYQGLPALNRR